jgi:uncharacterized DUF497 family protein
MNLSQTIEFQWDKGNYAKNFLKHNVSNEEIEEVFISEGKRIFRDAVHSKSESRFLLIGSALSRRKLFIVFTLRENKVRVISARDLSRKEVNKYYEKRTKTTKI